MRYLTAVPIAALAIVALPASAQADYSSCDQSLETTYSNRYYAVKKAHGTRAPGRNIRKWGVLNHGHQRRSTCKQIARSAQQLRRLLVAPRLMRSTAVPPRQRPAGTLSDFDTANLPACTWRPESGGSYTAYNASSGAYGKYQVIPSTWAAHCSDLGRGPAGQERCAARVYAAQGAGAWVNC